MTVPLGFSVSPLCLWHSCKLPEHAVFYPWRFFTKLPDEGVSSDIPRASACFVNRIFLESAT